LEDKTVSKKNFLEQIEVKNPCSEDWDEMTGNAEVRFCSHCNLNVNNLSALTRREALKIVRKSQGRICVRYVQNPVDKTPVFADKLYQITRRAGIAAGVLGASLTLSTLAFAQGKPRLLKREANTQTEISQTDSLEKDKNVGSHASISGTLTDPNGAVIPNISVVLINEENKETRNIVSNEEGFYEFKAVSTGNYTIRAEGIYGFKTFVFENVSISEGENSRRDIQMKVNNQTTVVVGDIAVVGYEKPLSNAVYENNIEEVKNLIAKGESINGKEKDSENITPLFIAVENGNAEITETLLNFGAKINARDENRQTPLMRLDEDASPELVRLLIKHGAKVNVTDEEGNTPLILAAKNANAEILQILIDHGADINAQNKEGQTTLMNAAYDDDLETVKILLRAGADVNLKNKEDESAWDLTTDEEVEKLLESHGAAVEEKDDETEDEDNRNY
jgi:ankyrin repeat protein